MSPRRRGQALGPVRRFDEIDSTNRYLADEARAGAAHGLVAVARHQTAGRGRLGRRWEAPPGTNLLVSILLRPSDLRPSREASVPRPSGAASVPRPSGRRLSRAPLGRRLSRPPPRSTPAVRGWPPSVHGRGRPLRSRRLQGRRRSRSGAQVAE